MSPTRLLITGRSYGTTNVVLTGANDQQYLLEVTVRLDLRRLNAACKKIDPLSDIHADSVLGNIVLTGTASGADKAARIVELTELFLPPAGESGQTAVVQNHLDIAGEQQVLLRCIVAEVNRAASRELGINGFLAGENFRDAFVVNQLGGINPINFGAAADAPLTGNIPFLTSADGIPLGPASSLSLGFPRIQMQLFIRSMADNSLLKVLAEPNLVAISGETATFLAGGEFPIPVPQGNQTVTIEFRKFGVRLNFTPTVRSGQRIRLRVAPEVSELDFANAAQFQGFIIPGLTSRAVETTVDLGNGETIAIAGLLSEQVRGFASRIPGIGDLPILGALFRSVSFRRSLSELVILVTPEIVAPLDAHQASSLEAKKHNDPNDFELYALGLLEGEDDSAGGHATRDQHSRRKDRRGRSALARSRAVSEPNNLSVHGQWGHAPPLGR
ncbi:MAG: type II and III secretion system protein family protein [Planctomycetes bacterium]|nr:type II and III secretion system protein family protein [Planctomycetota bacterium]